MTKVAVKKGVGRYGPHFEQLSKCEGVTFQTEDIILVPSECVEALAKTIPKRSADNRKSSSGCSGCNRRK